MRIATYNIEWFSNLFDDDNQLCVDDAQSGRYGVTRAEQVEAVAKVFTAMDADAILVIEAPDQGSKRSTVAALETFAQAFALRTDQAVMGFGNDTQQEIALLYDPNVLQARHNPRGSATTILDNRDAPRFDGTFHIDLDIDATEDAVQFSKPPLELDITTSNGRGLHMIGAHLKSKAPHAAKSHDQIMRLAIANRRKQLAQAIWLRTRIERHLQDGTPLIVLGDLNDGPGLDEYEHLFGRSSVEIVLGPEDGEAALFDPHARIALQRRLGANPTSARFYIPSEDRYLQALLDYIMVSPDLRAAQPRWRIWHPFDDPACWGSEELREALLTASDHFPVTLDLDI